MKISQNSLVKDIVTTYPHTFEVFLVNGFKYDSVESFINAVGNTTMLKTLLSIREINTDLFIYYLEERILKEESEKTFLLNDFTSSDKLDFYGNTICPLKFTFKDSLETIVKKNYEKTGEILNCYIESGKGAISVCDESFIGRDIESFPNLLFSKEFNEYLSKDFRDEMMGKGYFKKQFHESVNKEMLDAGICDPKGEYGVYAVMADVFLVDMERLGDLPVPKTTKDLLNPIYKDNIVIFGKQKKEFSNASFLYINKEFGEEGLKSLAHNVKSSLHGSQMSKVAGTKSIDGGAIYIVSWFFAKTCTKKNVKIIWPEDGAMTLPMYMLVKNNKEDRTEKIVDYITGEEFLRECVKVNTPVIDGKVDNCLPSGAKFKWLSWEYIRENDIASIAKKNEYIFMNHWREYHPNQEIFR
ncbi:MAG: ABC transporter substrate-binding protein [Clostridium sp.]